MIGHSTKETTEIVERAHSYGFTFTTLSLHTSTLIHCTRTHTHTHAQAQPYGNQWIHFFLLFLWTGKKFILTCFVCVLIGVSERGLLILLLFFISLCVIRYCIKGEHVGTLLSHLLLWDCVVGDNILIHSLTHTFTSYPRTHSGPHIHTVTHLHTTERVSNFLFHSFDVRNMICFCYVVLSSQSMRFFVFSFLLFFGVGVGNETEIKRILSV